MEYLGVVSEPPICGEPEIGVRLEVLDHGIELVIVCLGVHLEETLLHVELARVVLVPGQLLVHTGHVLSDIVMVVQLLVLMKILNSALQIVNRGLELFLLVLHLVQELDLVLV